MSTLTIDVTTDATAAAADLDAVAAAARGAGDAVSTAGGQVQSASSDFDRLGESSDNVASKGSQAAGALGDLAGGLDAVGASGAASALEGVALASQVAAGAGDALNLVAETSVGRWIANTAAAVAHRTATIAGTVATGAMTAAQTALNVVLNANPLALIVITLAALAAGLIYAYKHSETFREVVDGAMSRARAVIDAVAGAVEDVLGWFADLPGKAREAWEAVRQAVADKIEAAIGKVDDLIEKVTTGVSNVVYTVAGYFSNMFAPIQTAIGWVQDLINKIKSIHFPSIDIPGIPRVALPPTEGGGTRPPTTRGGGDTYLSIPITVDASGGTDPDATARRILETLERYAGRVPGAPVLVP